MGSRTRGRRFLFLRRGYARAVREDEEPRPETEEHPESVPTSVEDGPSTEAGEGRLDEPAEGGGTHRGW